jgi:ectoine hydroxylase-related dioxygenase (phytanoyl-CoA dioxygenase family)
MGDIESLRFSKVERDSFAQNGYLIREGVFSPEECEQIAADCEALTGSIEAEAKGNKETFGSYVFERDDRRTVIKWESDQPDLVHGVEFFVHLSEPLDKWSKDPRLVEPCKDVVGENEISLFTEKLNLKRKKKGGVVILHQDYPYWTDVTPVADRAATAMIFVDAASRENGCLEVSPGSHLRNDYAKLSVEGFGRHEMDPEQFDMESLVPVEVPEGSVVFFGPFLVHRSLPNTSDHDRRALLYSYQPAGHPHGRDIVYERLGAGKTQTG